MTVNCKLMYVLEGVVLNCLFQYRGRRILGRKLIITKSEQFFRSGIVEPWDSKPTEIVSVKSLHRLKW